MIASKPAKTNAAINMFPYNFQGFRVITEEYKPGFVCFQFQYKGFEISASNIGVNRGGCPSEITVFDNAAQVMGLFDTIEDAINFLNKE